MFKKIIAIGLCVISLVPCLVACNVVNGGLPTSSEKNNDLSPSIELQMREDFASFLREEYPHTEWKIDRISVQHFFGDFSGCEVVYMRCDVPYIQTLVPVEIADYTIVFPNGQPLYAYKNSNFYTIKVAYDTGLITREDVYAIGNMCGLPPKTP